MSPQERGTQSEPIIVAMGASAGGIQALQAFFRQIPDRTAAAYVVVVHLDPQHRSELPRILASCTRMPVVQVEGNEKILADRVYVIPPDRRLQLVDHEISATKFEEPHGQRAPIDQFFRSVAEKLGDGFAVILSGAGSDGAIGARAVKESGGIILVQDPNEAEYSSMPRSAIATGVADFVLPVRELTDRLAELIHIKRTTPPPEEPAIDEEQLRRILAHLRVRTGHDFSKYKRSTVVRRVARRMQVTRAEDLRQYYDILRDNPEEAQALLGDLLITVTTFFRDNEAFEALKTQVIPSLFDGRDPNETIRVWIPGCATGEEAYSVSMLLLEEASRRDVRPSIQVFGSDLDVRALGLAREGRYPASIETDVSEERLRRFFTREGDGYRVRQELRDVVLFSVHDMLKDPPFSRVDFVSCRNVLIYLDRELQEQVCSTFNYALKAGGFLLLGASETADNPPGLFRSLDRNARIYQSTTLPGDRPRLLPRLLGPIGIRDYAGHTGRAVSPSTALSEAALHRRILEQVAPPSVLVDETHRLVHLSESSGRYIFPAGGPLSGDVVDLVRPELRFELRSALHRVFEQGEPTLSLPILVRFNGDPHRVHLLVKLAEKTDSEPRQALVMFIEGEQIPEGLPSTDRQVTDETVRRLTQELELTQARLRTVREESEAANEELRAANEELQSINEEYRSTSEELETSKEELQSINEELQTVNSELKLKLEAISRAHSDLQNLMAATDFGTLFLDSALRIKRFTDRVTDLFSVTPADEGRPITDFAHQLEYTDLIKDARAVLADLAPVRREIRSRSGRWYDVRFRPYRTVDDRIDGVVITFVDISDRFAVEQALRNSEQQLRQQTHLVELSRAPIFVWEFDSNNILEWNRGSEELYGYARAEAIGSKKNELLNTNIPDSSFDELKARLQKDGIWSGEVSQRTKDGRFVAVETRLQLETFDGRRLVLESTRDVSERNIWEDRQRMLLHELGHRMKNTLAVVQAIAHQTLSQIPSSRDAVAQFEGRIRALGQSHDLLIESNWHGADLDSLARRQLAAYLSNNPRRLVITGEAVALNSQIATPLGLVLHELATNAAKHGSLSVAKGTVELKWAVLGKSNPRLLVLTWREKNGPPVEPPKSAKSGSRLIENAIPNAKVHRDFAASGLVCTIEVPVTNDTESAGRPHTAN
jgi:two-component system, chemotaxis family, CheB/CheR fusion protein